MPAGTMELNMNEMEMVNGGNLFGCMIAAIVGAGKGALTGGAAGMVVAGPPGAVVGAVVGALAEGTAVAYFTVGMDERNKKK